MSKKVKKDLTTVAAAITSARLAAGVAFKVTRSPLLSVLAAGGAAFATVNGVRKLFDDASAQVDAEQNDEVAPEVADAVTEAEAVLADEGASPEDIANATDALNSAMEKPGAEGPKMG